MGQTLQCCCGRRYRSNNILDDLDTKVPDPNPRGTADFPFGWRYYRLAKTCIKVGCVPQNAVPGKPPSTQKSKQSNINPSFLTYRNFQSASTRISSLVVGISIAVLSNPRTTSSAVIFSSQIFGPLSQVTAFVCQEWSGRVDSLALQWQLGHSYHELLGVPFPQSESSRP